jgi:hypothetical protein
MNQKIILGLIASAVVINLILAIGDVHGQGVGKSSDKIKINATETSSLEKEIQKQKQTGIYQKDPCLFFHDAHLVILDLTCPNYTSSLASYLAQGYEITAVWNNFMYLTK